MVLDERAEVHRREEVAVHDEQALEVALDLARAGRRCRAAPPRAGSGARPRSGSRRRSTPRSAARGSRRPGGRGRSRPGRGGAAGSRARASRRSASAASAARSCRARGASPCRRRGRRPRSRPRRCRPPACRRRCARAPSRVSGAGPRRTASRGSQASRRRAFEASATSRTTSASGGRTRSSTDDDRGAGAERREDPLGQLADRDLRARAEVQRLALDPGHGAAPDQPGDVVADVEEVARRVERAELDHVAGERLGGDRRDHRAGGLARPVGVERPRDDHGQVEGALEAERELVGADLRRRVRGLRVAADAPPRSARSGRSRTPRCSTSARPARRRRRARPGGRSACPSTLTATYSRGWRNEYGIGITAPRWKTIARPSTACATASPSARSPL